MVARRDEDLGNLGELVEVSVEHDDLDAHRNRIGDVGKVTGHCDDIDIGRMTDKPVVMCESVVQVRHYEDSHSQMVSCPLS